MEASKIRNKTDIISCRLVLNVMVILGFMFNYMLRVNMTIAILDMIDTNQTGIDVRNDTTHGNVSVSRLEETRYHWDETMKNDILGSFFWGYILTELPGGRLAEVIGTKKVFGGGMLAASIVTLLTPAATYCNYYVLLVFRVLLGLFLGATWPAMPPMVAKWIPPLERSKFMANMMASMLGSALTMPLCGMLISWYGWASVFYVTGAIGLVWSFLWFFLIHDSPAEHPRITWEERSDIESKIAQWGGGRTVKPEKVPWISMACSAPVWAIVICHGCSGFGYFTVINQLPTYMNKVLHFDIKKNGLLSSLPYLGKYIVAILASHLADFLRRSGRLSTTATRKIFTSFAMLFPGMIVIALAFWGQNPTLAVTIFTIALTCNGAVTGGYMTNGLDIAPNYSGTILGISNTLASSAGWVSTKIVGIVTAEHNTFSEWRIVFWLLVLMYFVGGISFVLLASGDQQPWNSRFMPDERSKETKPLNELEEDKEAREHISA